MPRPGGQLERSLAALTIGVHQAQDKRRRALADGRTGEYEQQIQLAISGSAANVWGFFDKQVNWEWPFLYAPLQRRVPFKVPQFKKDFEMTGPIAELVLLDGHVVGWTVTEENWIVGATVRFAACAPQAITPVQFQARAHLSFQGYATYAEGDEFTP